MHDWIRRKRGGTKLFEDELTSCVFGPLRYMEPSHAWDSCLMLFGNPSWLQNLELRPTCVDVRFWPRFPRDDGTRSYVEPDVHIVAWNGNALLGTILVETKWNSPLGNDQLLEQWRLIAVDGHECEDIRRCTVHVLLSDRPFRDMESIEQQRLDAREERIGWNNRLSVMSWFQVAAQLSAEQSQHRPVEVWRNDLVGFLSSRGIVAFDGFRPAQFESVELVQWQIEAYMKPVLLKLGSLNWTFDGGFAA